MLRWSVRGSSGRSISLSSVQDAISLSFTSGTRRSEYVRFTVAQMSRRSYSASVASKQRLANLL